MYLSVSQLDSDSQNRGESRRGKNCVLFSRETVLGLPQMALQTEKDLYNLLQFHDKSTHCYSAWLLLHKNYVWDDRLVKQEGFSLKKMRGEKSE